MRKNPQVLVLGLLVLAGAIALVSYLTGPGRGADRLASSGDPQERLKAVEASGGDRSEAASERLSQLSRDSDLRVARGAVRALADNRTDRNRELLMEIMEDKSRRGRVRGEAAATLGEYEGTDFRVLTNALRDPDKDARAGAAKGLVRLRKPEAVPELYRALSDPDPEVRMWAISAINKVVVIRFNYDAGKPPGSQVKQIEYIGQLLRQRGLL